MYPDLPDRYDNIEPGKLYEVCWTSYMPFHASARVGAVHLVTRESYPRTLCGIQLGRPSNRFLTSPGDRRCQRCERLKDEPRDDHDGRQGGQHP